MVCYNYVRAGLLDLIKKKEESPGIKADRLIIANRGQNVAIIAGVAAVVFIALAALALSVILGAPILTALASLALPTLIVALVVGGLSLTISGLYLDASHWLKNAED